MIIIWLFFVFLAVPILVHLFNFRKAKKLYFSNIKFINKVSTETKSKTRLKHYLLLVTRVLMFLFLLFVLFSLFNLRNTSSNEGYFIYLDNSVSQSIENQGTSNLTEAKKMVSDLLSKDQKSTLLTNDFLAFSNTSKSSEELLNELFLVDYSFSQPPIYSIGDRLNASDLKKAVIFSDMQGVSSDELNRIVIDSLHDYSLIVSDAFDKNNAFIDTAFIEYDENEFTSIKLNLRVGSSGNFSEGNIVVKLLSDGIQVSSVVKKITEAATIQFDILRTRNKKYEILLSGDEVEYDNSYFFTIGDAKKPKVALISDGKNIYLNQVFRNEELFDFFEMDKNSIDFSILEGSDLIIINNLNSLPNGIFNQLNESTFIIFPSDSVDYSMMNSSIGLNILESNDNAIYRSIFDSNNKLFSGIFSSDKKKGLMPMGSAIFSFQGIYESVIELGSGMTFLAKSPERNIYMLSCPLEERYTNLQVHGIFLPMMYQLAMHSAQNGNSHIFNYPNQLVVVNGNLSEIPIKMVGENFEIIPEFYRSKRDIVLRIPPATPPGFYSLIQEDDTLRTIAVNLVKSESIMEGIRVDELQDFLKDVKHVSVHKLDSQVSAEYLLGETPSGLWKYALILVLFFLLTETMLHKYLK